MDVKATPSAIPQGAIITTIHVMFLLLTILRPDARKSSFESSLLHANHLATVVVGVSFLQHLVRKGESITIWHDRRRSWKISGQLFRTGSLFVYNRRSTVGLPRLGAIQERTMSRQLRKAIDAGHVEQVRRRLSDQPEMARSLISWGPALFPCQTEPLALKSDALEA
jgi:hypothetical protein